MILRDVVAMHGRCVALRGVSAVFHAGSVTLVVGANGSGKSTLLSVLATAAAPSSGSIAWHPIGDDRSLARPHIGWLSHDSHLYADLTGRQNLVWHARMRGIGEDRVAEVCERFALGGFADRPVRQMSRGQKQRVALARTLLHAPSVILLDEPTTGLDARGTEMLLRVVEAEIARGALVALVTHEPGLFAQWTPRVVHLDRGRAVTESSLSAL